MKEQIEQNSTTTYSNTTSSHQHHHQQQQQQQQFNHSLHHHSKDVNHSSDTEDCDLELGAGRLVIDLEAMNDPDEKSSPQKSTDTQSSAAGSSINNNAGNVISISSNNIVNNSQKKLSSSVLKMNHCFSEVSNNAISTGRTNANRMGYSANSVAGGCGSSGITGSMNGSFAAASSATQSMSQVSYSTVSLTGQDHSSSAAQPNKCIKMKIKRNPLGQGQYHAPLSASSQLSATLHQQQLNSMTSTSHASLSTLSSTPPSLTSSSSTNLPTSQHSFSTVVVASSGNNGHPSKPAVLENSVFTYKIQHCSMSNCTTGANSVTCKNVPLGSLPSLSNSSAQDSVRGMNHHQHSANSSYLSEGSQTIPYTSNSTATSTRGSKQPPNKRMKQSSHNANNNNTAYRDSITYSKQNATPAATSLASTTVTYATDQSNLIVYSNSSKQAPMGVAAYSNVTGYPFGYDPTACSKYSSRVTHKTSAIANGREKVTTVSSDPYDFNCTSDDGSSLILKKARVEKCERACSPIAASKRDAEVDACHVGLITDPDCLGPCEPGTSVTLEGIVWNETENGLLVVNVTWRGKTYVGTLMDATRHHWAPPRFTGESPTSDLDGRTQKGRGKRGRNNPVAPPPPARPDNGSDRKLRSNRNNGGNKQLQTAPSPIRTNGVGNPDSSLSSKKTRNEASAADQTPGFGFSRSGKTSARSESRMSFSESSGHEDTSNSNCSNSNSLLIECPEENCNKKYKNSVGLKYHQTRCHQNKTTSSSSSSSSSSSTPTDTTTVAAASEPKAPIVKDVNAKEASSKSDLPENASLGSCNSLNVEDGNTSMSSSSSANHKSRTIKSNSTARGEPESHAKHVSEAPTNRPSQKLPEENKDDLINSSISSTANARSNANTPTILSTTQSSTALQVQSISCLASSCTPEKPAHFAPINNNDLRHSALPANTFLPDVSTKINVQESESVADSNKIIVTSSNSTELKYHSVTTMTYQTTETHVMTDRSNKRKKKERHAALERTELNLTADGCSAPSAKNIKLDDDSKENNGVNSQPEKPHPEPSAAIFSSVSSLVMSSGASSSSSPTSALLASSSSIATGNLYACSLEKLLHATTSSEDGTTTPFKASPVVYSSSVIKSTTGLTSASVYETTDSCTPIDISMSTSNENPPALSANSSSDGGAEKRSSPLSAINDFQSHISGMVPSEPNSPDFSVHNKKLRLSLAHESSKTMQKSSSDITICQDAPSPAYSDISDANENAPMLEKEANQTTINNDDDTSVMRCLSSEGPSTPMSGSKQLQDSFVCSPFYGLMPQLTPVVSSPAISRDFSNKFSLVGSSSSTQYSHRESTSPVKSPVVLTDNQKTEHKFTESVPLKKHEFSQSSQRSSSGQSVVDTLRKTPSISSSEAGPSPQVQHLLTVPPAPTSGFHHPSFFPNMYLYDREMRAQYERYLEMQQKQLYDGEMHKQDLEGKYGSRSENSLPKSGIDDRFKHSNFLPAPPSLIPDHNRFKQKEEYSGSINPALWEGSRPRSRDIPDLLRHPAPTSDHHNSKNISSDKYDRRYLPPPHMLDQPFQHHSHQSSKGVPSEGGKPSAVVAPQTREKTVAGSQPLKNSYDSNNRENRTTQQQLQHQQQQHHSKYSSATSNNYQASYAPKSCRDNRQQLKDDTQKKEESGSKLPSTSSSLPSMPNAKMKLKSSPVDSASSQPTGLQLPPSPSPMPAPYPPPAPFYNHFLSPPGAPYTGVMHHPFESAFLSGMNPMAAAALLQQPPYGLHPSQILHPAAAAPSALSVSTSDSKSQPSNHPHHRPCLDFDSNVAHHKIHELKEVAKGETSSGNPGSSAEMRPLSSGGMQHPSVIQSGGSSSSSSTRESGKDKDLSAEPTLQRHLHTHHHMHVIGPSMYPYMNSEAAMLVSQQANSSGVSPQLPRPSYLGK